MIVCTDGRVCGMLVSLSFAAGCQGMVVLPSVIGLVSYVPKRNLVGEKRVNILTMGKQVTTSLTALVVLSG
jgi:hypothetical protein